MNGVNIESGETQTRGAAAEARCRGIAGLVHWEYAGYTYDGSGNVSSFAASSLGYDARSRLTSDVGYGRTEYRRYDDFGNVTLSTAPWRTFNPDRATNRHSQPNPYTDYQEYDPARGYLKYDSTSYVGRDFYADGRVLSEYGRIAPSYAPVRDNSVYLLGADKERLLTFNAEDSRCDTELFRHTLRDPFGRVLTDYKADHQAYCDCSVTYQCAWTDRFERDYIWLGNQALVILDRQQAPRFDVLDHLGSPRHAFDSAGGPLGDRVFTAFGEELGVAGTMPERIRFTGHERNHVTGSDGQFLAISDYMHARNYAPTLSRFVTPDMKPGFRLFNPEGANRYAYVLNNPLTFTDPTGNDEEGARPVFAADGKSAYYSAATGAVAEDPDRVQREIMLSMLSLGFFGNVATASEVRVSRRPEDLPLMTWDQFTFKGGAAYIDGAIPVPGWNPLADAHLYSSSDLGIPTAHQLGVQLGSPVLQMGALRGVAWLGSTRLGRPLLNASRYFRIGPGRMPRVGRIPGNPEAPRISIGPQRPNQTNPHIDLRFPWIDY